MVDHPIDTAVVDDTDVSKSSFRSVIKDGVRFRVASAAIVRAADYSDWPMLDVAGVAYDRDNSDTTSADSGGTAPAVLVDSVGTRFDKVVAPVTAVSFDAFVDDIAARADYEAEALGFVVLVADSGDGRAALYSLTDNGSPAAWSDPAYVTGEQGEQGDASTVAGPAGISGTSALTRVRVVDTTGLDPDTAYEAGDTVDGLTLVTNDLVLRAAATGESPDISIENGVYVVPASGAASRHTDFDAYDDLPGTGFRVMEGTANADTLWFCNSDRGGTLGTTALAIEEFEDGGGSGDVVGPASSTAGRVARFADTTGKLLEEKPAASFHVHKNGTNQTGIVASTDTKLTWETEADDTGGYFDLANNRWTPPAGQVLFTGKIQFSAGVVDQSFYQLRLYKNGSLYVTATTLAASGSSFADLMLSFRDLANGTDYYELYVSGSGAGDKTISGLAISSFWMGVLL